MTERQLGTRTLTWYAVTALAVLAILIVNSDRQIMGSSEDLPTVELIGSVGRRTPKMKKPIQMIAMIGERNSGTRWLYEHIAGCFNHSLGVKRSLTRYKHWFQHKNATKYPHDTLVLAQFRNPYDWFERMLTKPHHAPDHVGLKWRGFLEKPWTTERVGRDLSISQNTLCQEDFRYQDVVSCVVQPLPTRYWINKTKHFSEHQPLYEMRPDGSGKPFASIMQLRAAKIRNFLGIRDYVGVADVWTVQYEYLLSKGTGDLLTKIEEWTGTKRQCVAEPPKARPGVSMSRTFARYLNTQLDWSAEGLVGYTQKEF